MILYGVAALGALLLPLVMISLQVPFIRIMDDTHHPIALLQLFIFTASAMLSGILLWKMWGRNGVALRAELPLLMGILVAFHFLTIMRHHAARSWDYACYERAAQAIVAGLNPYGDCYIYFPTPAQALAGLEELSAWGITLLGSSTLGSTSLGTVAADNPAPLWDLVFYFYEASQLLLVILAFALCYRLALRLHLRHTVAAILVAVLFLINNPLLATLKHNQVNLWVLDLLLLAMLWLPRYPFLSGFLVAVGIHIKLYPLALLLPWTLKRQWRGLFGATVGLGGIFLLQTNGGRQLQLWEQFFEFAGSFPRGTFFRDNSLHSLVYNTLGHLKWVLGRESYPVNETHVSWIVLVGMVLLGIFYLLRFVQRESHHAHALPTHDARVSGALNLLKTGAAANASEAKVLGHSFDAIALALIAAPVVWEHHYLLAMPLVIGAVAWAQTERQLWFIGISLFGIFVLPTFDVFPFSYHRLAGLLLLMHIMTPSTSWHRVRFFAAPPTSSQSTGTEPRLEPIMEQPSA